VLVVACPCPLILATPSAVMAAMAWLARTGVVVKGSEALERLARADTFVFDKTGTLTRGELELGDIRPLGTLDEPTLLRIAAIAERPSEHVLARLVVREVEALGSVIPLAEDFTAQPGFGVVTRVRASALGDWAADDPGHRCTLVVGNRRLLEQQQVSFAAESQTATEFAGLDDELEQAGQSVLFVAVDGELLGAIGVRDSVRDESREVLTALRAEGIERIVMLSGDRDQPARAVADSLGLLDEVHAELLPADKAAWIEDATREGRHVAMVGDGVNDAPALAAATVGIALGGVGSDIAAEAGDLVLMGDPLRPLPGLLQLSRQLVKIIRQSIWVFAFGMNAVGMLAGAFGLLPPAAAAVFHELASLAVMANAMRLLWFQRWDQTSLGATGRRLSTAAAWLTAALSPERWTFRLIGHWRLIARLAAAVGALAWLGSNIVLLREGEEAVVTRFGGALEFGTDHEPTLKAGLHWRWPAPFERVYRDEVDRVRSLPIGFRGGQPVAPKELSLPPVEWTSPHDELNYEPIPLEALTLTGDEVPVELTAELLYRIDDLKVFALGTTRPEETLRAMTQAAIRQVAAGRTLDDLLTGGRQQIESKCLEAIKQAEDACDLGVDIIDLDLLDIHPPRQVVPAYRQVADALEEREQLINEARAYYARRLLGAAGTRAIDRLNAFDPTVPGKRSRQGDIPIIDWSQEALAQWKALREENLLSGEAAATIDSAERDRAVRVARARSSADRFRSLLEADRSRPGNRPLTRLHLYFRAVEDVLARRTLTILDPAVAGRRHLLLTDPLMPGTGPLLAPSLRSHEEEQIVSPRRTPEKTDER